MSSRTRTKKAAKLDVGQEGQRAEVARPDAPIERLPAHLFVDILALLQTHELAQAARVCKSWSQVVSTPYLWSRLSFISHDDYARGQFAFTVKEPSRTVKVPWQKIIERSKGRIMSVELGYLPHHNISKLVKLLIKKAAPDALKHIRWTQPHSWHHCRQGIQMDAAHRVLELAQACPNITTLEVLGHFKMPSEPFFTGHLQTAKLERFRTDAYMRQDVYAHLLNMLSKSKSVVIHSGCGFDMTVLRQSWLLALLGTNPVLEEFLGEHFVERDGWPSESGWEYEPEEDSSITTSLSLKRLTLKIIYEPNGRQGKIHAPNLRELSTDSVILHKLSDETLSDLATLNLTVSRPSDPLPSDETGRLHWLSAPSATNDLQRIISHVGDMTLRIDRGCHRQTAPILGLLASRFLWPGLTHITMDLHSDTLYEELPRLIAARQAGAQGASKEQYEAIASGASSGLVTESAAPSPGALPVEATAMAGLTFEGPPLCKELQWRINNFAALPPDTIAWLEKWDNVTLREYSHDH